MIKQIILILSLLFTADLLAQDLNVELSKRDYGDQSKLIRTNKISGLIKTRYQAVNDYQKGDIEEYHTVFFTQKGDIIREIDFNSEKKEIDHIFYRSYLNDKICDPYPVYKKVLTGYEQYFYDAKGELVERSIYSKERKLKYRILYIRNRNGDLQQTITQNSNKNTILRKFYYRSINQIVIDNCNMNSNDSLISKEIIYLDERKLVTKKKLETTHQGIQSEYHYQYNSKGLLTEAKYFENGTLKYIDSFQYLKTKMKDYLLDNGFDLQKFTNSIGNSSFEGYYIHNQAKYSGGEKALQDYLLSELNKLNHKFDYGVVLIEATVGVDGKIIDKKIIRSLSSRNDAIAKQIIEQMPDWIPAKNSSSIPYDSKITIPIAFL